MTEILQTNWGWSWDPLFYFPQQYHLPKQIKLLSMSQMNDVNAETGDSLFNCDDAETGDSLFNCDAQKNSRKGDIEILIKWCFQISGFCNSNYYIYKHSKRRKS